METPMRDINKCEGCPLDGMYEPVEAIGPETARFIVVTDTPSAANAKKGKLMSGGAMTVFARTMLDKGFEQEDFRFVPACHCAYDPNEHVSKVLKGAHKHCRVHLEDEVEATNPEVVIPLGAPAATAAFGENVKITKVRGIAAPSQTLGVNVFPLMSPTLVVNYPQNAPVYDADVASFARYVEADYDTEVAGAAMTGEYEVVTDLQFLIDQRAEILAFDTENTGLRFYQKGIDVRNYRPELHKGSSIFRPKFQILSMQFTTESGKGYMLIWDHPEAPIPEERKPRLRNQLRQLLCNPETIVVGQNLKYDNIALWMTEGIRFRIGGDTMMLATLVDENMPEKNLDVLTKIFVPDMAGYADVFNATVDKSRMWEVPISKLVNYGCGDTDATFRLYNVLEEIVAQDEGQWTHYCRVTVPGLNALAGMETKGMFIDQEEALANFKQTMIDHVTQAERELLAQVPRAVKRDAIAEYTGKGKPAANTVEKAIALTRPDFLKQVLFTHPQGFKLKPKVFTKTTAKLNDETMREPSVSAKDHLPYFFETCPFTEPLAEYIKDNSLLTKSVISFELKYIVDGKVRPTYHLHKAVTGRTSSDDPNGQNYPKRGERALAYRRMFVPPPGYFVCEMDLSQAELRIAACMSGDRTMIEIYRTGGDIHKATGAIVLGVTPEQFERLPKSEQKDARTKAKAVNFGFLYGMGWRKFIGYAKTQYGVDFTEKEAQRVRTGFFNKYKSLGPWHEKTKRFAARHKMVRSYSGRVRHLPMVDSAEEYIQQEAMRQAINSPVQEFGSSLGVMSLGRMNDEVDPEYLQVVGFIHDAIVVYVKKEYLDWGMKTVKRYMQTNPLTEWFGTTLQVPIIADCGFGLNLGEVHECEGFSLDEPFDYDSLRDKEGNLKIEVPEQEIPPNNGMLTRSVYTLPTDMECETAVARTARKRLIRAGVTEATVKRITRSKKQMIINRRNKAIKEDQSRVLRRTRLSSAAVK
jgi:uracil-DNA glycosylase family 4